MVRESPNLKVLRSLTREPYSYCGKPNQSALLTTKRHRNQQIGSPHRHRHRQQQQQEQ
jgi:hypothetical protein